MTAFPIPECFNVSLEIVVNKWSFFNNFVLKSSDGNDLSGNGESQSANADMTPFSTNTSFKSCFEMFFKTSLNHI